MEEFPEINRREIDRGVMSQDAVTLADCVRSSLFTSRGVRKDTKVIVYPLGSKSRLIRIEGDKLRYMGPDERSVSILLSMSATRLATEGTGNEISSPGITVVRKSESLAGLKGDSLVVFRSSEGSDQRAVRLGENVACLCALDCERGFGDIGDFLEVNGKSPIAVKTHAQIDKAILIMNNELDRQYANERSK